jgi:hypothetical protein
VRWPPKTSSSRDLSPWRLSLEGEADALPHHLEPIFGSDVV